MTALEIEVAADVYDALAADPSRSTLAVLLEERLVIRRAGGSPEDTMIRHVAFVEALNGVAVERAGLPHTNGARALKFYFWQRLEGLSERGDP